MVFIFHQQNIHIHNYDNNINISIYKYVIFFKVGDIIVLQKEEECPADILILDSQEKNLLADTHSIDGKKHFSSIKPLLISFGINFQISNF